jgi:hypothetical protein
VHQKKLTINMSAALAPQEARGRGTVTSPDIEDASPGSVSPIITQMQSMDANPKAPSTERGEEMLARVEARRTMRQRGR